MGTNTLEEVAVSTWSVDPVHSALHFKVRHMAITWVRGEFRIRQGTLRLNDSDISESRIDIDIGAASVNSGEPQRDQHVRSADFLEVERFPSIHFTSLRVTQREGRVTEVIGELTVHGVSRSVAVNVTEISGPARDPRGAVRMGASGSAQLSRKDFGLTWNTLLETGGVLVGDEIHIDLDVQFVKAAN